MLFSLSKTTHAPLAATVTAFSTYFTGLCIYASRVGQRRPEPKEMDKATLLFTYDINDPKPNRPSKIGQMDGFGGSAGVSHIEWSLLPQVDVIENTGCS